MIPNLLTVAGSDPSGGAGIQADLKTFSALGCYGMSVITSLTAQNTRGVSDIHDVPADFVRAQIEMIFKDIKVSAIKTGMIGAPATVLEISKLFQKFQPPYVVVDPVMASQSGHKLINDEAIDALKTKLIPMADIITPNIPEAKILLGPLYHSADHQQNVKQLLKLGARAVLLKGGHDQGAQSNDVFMDREGNFELLEARRIDTKNNHGTGCTLASAIACGLAKGLPPLEACRAAKAYITRALGASDQLAVGQGHGPVHHFHSLWK